MRTNGREGAQEVLIGRREKFLLGGLPATSQAGTRGSFVAAPGVELAVSGLLRFLGIPRRLCRGSSQPDLGSNV